jgi:hypothetical protein
MSDDWNDAVERNEALEMAWDRQDDIQQAARELIRLIEAYDRDINNRYISEAAERLRKLIDDD